jgi:CRP-like cAMP-binding protein
MEKPDHRLWLNRHHQRKVQLAPLIHEGFVRIELGEDGVAVNQLGPGEVIGEVSSVESVAASADVVAGSDVTVDAIAGERLQSLLASEPAFAARFHQSLAVTLSARLRRISHKLARLGIHEVAQIHPFRRPLLHEAKGICRRLRDPGAGP